MDSRIFGRSGMTVSVLGFGCGAVGGLMVRGSAADQARAFARALDSGVSYFDTAAQYGDGESERNLGRLIRTVRPSNIVVGTKVRLRAEDRNIRDAVITSLEASLQRLGLQQVDILHLHNAINTTGGRGALTPAQVLGEVVPAFELLRRHGKIRFCGVTAVGDTAAIRAVVDSGSIDSAQIVFNLLNPTAASSSALPPNYPAQDFAALLNVAKTAGVGTIGIRILAGGALAGTAERQPNASPAPQPIGSATSFDGDLAHARRFAAIVHDGLVGSLVELAIRYAITEPGIGTALIGLASQADLDMALASVEKGPLPQDVLARVATVQALFAGEVG
jgi:aryl-alcohol dehydrogenase-like predicted oxidoreductase